MVYFTFQGGFPAFCKTKSVVAGDVFDTVIHFLNIYIEEFEAKIDTRPDVEENTIASQIEILQAELRKTEKKMSKLFGTCENEKIVDNELVKQKTVNNEWISAIKNPYLKVVVGKIEFSRRNNDEFILISILSDMGL